MAITLAANHNHNHNHDSTLNPDSKPSLNLNRSPGHSVEALNVFAHFLPAATSDTAAETAAAFKRFAPLVRSLFDIAAPCPTTTTTTTSTASAATKATTTTPAPAPAPAKGLLSALWTRLAGESPFSADHECAAPSADVLLRRCVRHDVCGPHELALALIYLHRLHKRRRCLTPRTLDKYVLVAIMLAAKYLQDSPYNNQAMATIARLPLPHLNRLELAVLADLSFSLTPTDEEWLAFWPLVARPAAV